MKAIILAAGRGSRLQHLTDEKPKCLMPLGGRTLLEWQLAALQAAGIRDISIVTGYLAEMLEPFPGKKIFNPLWEKSNMVWSLLCAEKEFTEPVIVTYSDIVYREKVVQTLIDFDAAKDLVLTYDLEWQKLWESRFQDPLSDAESFKINSEGRMVEIGQKTQKLQDIQGQYMGLLRFTPQAFTWFRDFVSRQPERVSKLDMTSVLSGLIQEGRPIFGVPIAGGWCEVDTPRDLEVASQLFSSHLF